MLGFDFSGLANIKRYANDFEELQKIGKGGFSTVYKVRSRLDQQLYAIKKIKIKPSEYRDHLQEHLEKVLREGRLLSELTHQGVLKYHAIWFEVGPKADKNISLNHQGVTKQNNHHANNSNNDSQFEMIIDSEENSDIGFAVEEPEKPKVVVTQPKEPRNKSEGKEKRRPEPTTYNTLIDFRPLNDFSEVTIYIQTELCKQSLNDLVTRRLQNGADPQSFRNQNQAIILQLVNALDFIHSRKIIHRDLKLHNVLVDSFGKIKICDFGLAKKCRAFRSCFIVNQVIEELSEQDLDKFSSSVGTKIFSSPQQSSSNNYDHRTDIYSLGVMMAIMYAKWTTKHEEFQIINRIRSNNGLAEFLPTMPASLVNIVGRCVGEPDQRPSLNEIRLALLKLDNPVIGPFLLKVGRQPEFKAGCLLRKKHVFYIGNSQGERYTRMVRANNELALSYCQENTFTLTSGDALLFTVKLSRSQELEELKKYLDIA